jgi:dynein heavy chain 2
VNTDTTEGLVTDLKYKALIMDTVHNMDVVQQLKDARIRNNYDWLWQKQLRFYLENNKAIIKMVDAQFNYTYEYQGNAQKLVHTPLTDKCYLTLTQGMHMGFGGNPVGIFFQIILYEISLILVWTSWYRKNRISQSSWIDIW